VLSGGWDTALEGGYEKRCDKEGFGAGGKRGRDAAERTASVEGRITKLSPEERL